VSGSGISWAICNSALSSRQITTPAHHRSVFYRPDALPAAQPTVSKHWRHKAGHTSSYLNSLNIKRHVVDVWWMVMYEDCCLSVHLTDEIQAVSHIVSSLLKLLNLPDAFGDNWRKFTKQTTLKLLAYLMTIFDHLYQCQPTALQNGKLLHFQWR